MNLGGYARSGQGGKISKSDRARTGDIITKDGNKDAAFPAPEKQPSVPSNIPGAAAQGVPLGDKANLGEFARKGNGDCESKVVSMQMGMTESGPKWAASVARMGGQVQLAPGQLGAWGQSESGEPKKSDQVSGEAQKPSVKPIGV